MKICISKKFKSMIILLIMIFLLLVLVAGCKNDKKVNTSKDDLEISNQSENNKSRRELLIEDGQYTSNDLQVMSEELVIKSFITKDIGNNPGNHYSLGESVEYLDKIFFNSSGNGLQKMSIDGSELTTFYKYNMYYMQAYEGWLYGAIQTYDLNYEGILEGYVSYERVNIENGTVEVLYKQQFERSFFDGKRLFLSWKKELKVIDINTGDIETIQFDDEMLLSDFIVNEDYLFYNGRVLNLITKETDIFEQGYRSKLFYNGRFYYCDNEYIYSVDSLISNPEIVVDCYAQSFVISDNRIIIADRDEGIFSVNLNGKDKVSIYKNKVYQLSVSGSWLFFVEETESEQATRVRMALDGNERIYY